MIKLEHTYDEEHVTFTAQGASRNLISRMLKGTAPDPDVDKWAAGIAARYDGLGALRQYGEANPDSVSFGAGHIVASHAAVASMTGGQARSLGLPAHSPFSVAADTTGVIGSPDFELRARWFDGERPVAVRRTGAFLETSRGVFLIPEPQYSLVVLADGFDAGSVDLPDHWEALARFRRLLDSEEGHREQVEMSDFLRGLRIYTGTALSLALSGTPDNLDFDPVLFDAEAAREAREAGRVFSEKDTLLPEAFRGAFRSNTRTGFRAFDSAKPSYLLGPKTYLIVDDDLETALQLVREKQRAGPDERRAFATNPGAAIAERLISRAELTSTTADEAVDEDIEARISDLFIETPEYADRAIRIGLWKPPKLDFLPRQSNKWLPESFSLELGGVWVSLTPETVSELRENVDTAIAEGESHVAYQGEQVPATPEVREKLANLVATAAPGPSSGTGATGTSHRRDPLERTVVIVHENFEEENWAPENRRRQTAAPNIPPSVRARLLDHQREALAWQVKGWCAGHPGLLNADDQGLGKTLQTLAFLAWLKEEMSQLPEGERHPVLVVAPTGLLRTWRDEEQNHLKGTRLGARIDAFGPGLRELRVHGLSGRDTDDGVPRLGFDALRDAIRKGHGHEWWVLTTYETLANYQHSFRNVHFSTVVFDEVQKIKNPKTLMALAARGVRAEFRIGLTGTPLENHVVDLWAVMDVVVPGRLKTLKEFLDSYGDVTEENMRELHGRLFHPIQTAIQRLPPVGQRRLKEDVLADLPRKDYRVYPAIMPTGQARAYEVARQHLVDGARGATLKLLHHIRGVSLHPDSPDTETENSEAYFLRSARFDSLRRILAQIRERGERVLVFTENRRMQSFVAQWIRSEFGLREVRIINGATTIARRKKYVFEFQRHLEQDGGFDVLILSPRAAGVGLTLTAATHVIHLSRWWNPAVEEQCNDRIYRIGQDRDVMVHLPLAIHPVHRERSFDCVLNDLMRRKRSLARAALWPPTLSDVDNAALVTGMSGAEAFDPKEVDNLDWQGFENWVIDQARKSDDWETSTTPSSGDGGADALLRHRRRADTTALVQAKHTTNRNWLASESAVDDLLRARSRYPLRQPQLVAITNAAGFTEKARTLALEENVLLVDRDRLGLWPNHILA